MSIRIGRIGSDSVRQNIGIILNTKRGSVPYRPSFGLGLEDWIDRVDWQRGLVMDVIEQLEKYEPRIKVKKVLPQITSTSAASIHIVYDNLLNGSTESKMDFSLSEAIDDRIKEKGNNIQ